jgi:hypothetical protein
VKKKIVVSVCIIAVIVVGSIIYTLTNIDSIVKSVVENVISKATGTKVTIGSVDISLSKGKATIRGLKIANPQGFSNDSMMDLGAITAQINYKTGAITNLHIEKPYFLLEQKGSETNFDVIQKHLSGPEKTHSSEPKESSSSAKEKGSIYQIDSFKINDAQISVSSIDTGKSAKVTIDSIQLDNLKGTPDEICQQILLQITTQIIQSSAKELLQKEIEKNLGNTINSGINNFLGK